MTVRFHLDGQEFTALNGGSVFSFNEAVSFVVHCESQREVDYYWENLLARRRDSIRPPAGERAR